MKQLTKMEDWRGHRPWVLLIFRTWDNMVNEFIVGGSQLDEL